MERHFRAVLVHGVAPGRFGVETETATTFVPRRLKPA